MITVDECPRRSLTTFTWTPASRASVAQVCLRSCLSRHRLKHDLRHSFATSSLIAWYRAGVDVQERLPLLSAYLGHVGPSTTYWYLSAAPELLTLAAQRAQAAQKETR